MRMTGGQLLGILLVVVGAAFLLRNAGLLDLDWPTLGAAFLVVVGFVVLARGLGTRRDGEAAVRVARGPAGLELDVSAGAVRLSIAGGSADLFELESPRRDVRSTVDSTGARARVRVRQDAVGRSWQWTGVTDWSVHLASDVPVALDLTIGAGQLDLDLLDVRLVGARLSLGAASGALRLPRPVGDIRIDVTLGAASLRVGVPTGVEARVSTTGGLVSLTGQRETPGWSSASDRVTVAVSGGASSVRVVSA
jgi:hypothetical protein